MPIYEYQCDSCGANFDAIQKFSDAPLSACRQCGAEGVRKLLSAPSFRLKGGGWYETDFKNKNQRNVVKKDGDGGSAGSGTDSGGSASKGDGAGKDGGSTKTSSGSDSGGSGSATAA
ncbi:MAG: zinc ribbon domain-containing protein [Gammaproteobacteria bacterium]|nr:zinc ribbon domain-containing protein [Gammaproteobacteria bacterium]